MRNARRAGLPAALGYLPLAAC